jgi:hypothetical protein
MFAELVFGHDYAKEGFSCQGLVTQVQFFAKPE